MSLGFGSTLKAVAVRLWTSLYFPLNWSTDPSLPLALLAVAYMAAMIWLGVRAEDKRGRCGSPAIAILICVIPVLSLLAGSPALAGSRVLYLPSVWFAILIALALDGVPARVRYAWLPSRSCFTSRAPAQPWILGASVGAREGGLRDRRSRASGLDERRTALANGKPECIEIARDTSSRP